MHPKHLEDFLDQIALFGSKVLIQKVCWSLRIHVYENIWGDANAADHAPH